MDELCLQLSRSHISARLQRQAEAEELAAKQGNAWFLKQLPLVWERRLPIPDYGRRPVWEPPDLDYSMIEVLIEAQKEMNVKEGSSWIAWRTEMFDNFVERLLLMKYQNWIDAQKKDSRDCGNEEELSFWRKLLREVGQDWYDGVNERNEIVERHGKSLDDWRRLRDNVTEIAKVKHARFESSDWRWDF